jgi:hypothetical protein
VLQSRIIFMSAAPVGYYSSSYPTIKQFITVCHYYRKTLSSSRLIILELYYKATQIFQGSLCRFSQLQFPPLAAAPSAGGCLQPPVPCSLSCRGGLTSSGTAAPLVYMASASLQTLVLLCPPDIETMHYIKRVLRKYLTRIKTHSCFSPPVSILILGKRFCEKILNIGGFIAL